MKRTPLYDLHVELGGRMVDFAGWEMPIQYSNGINDEHMSVRTDCGLFDVSHMGELRVRGPDAVRFLQWSTLNDAGKLKPGRAQYSMLPNDHGGLIDDLYVYCESEDDYLIVCNAGNTPAVVAHLQALAEGFDCRVDDESDAWALLALQGPGAALMLERLVRSDLTAVRKNRSRDATLEGHEVKLTRTGYTGEDGFEIFCRPADAAGVWRRLIAAGAAPCGLGARDTLRLEAGFPLYGHELDEHSNPLCTPFAWVVKDKPFYGREAMWAPDCRRRLVGLVLNRRGIARQGYRLYRGGQIVGEVTSGTISPLSREGIAMGWLERDLATAGEAISVEIRGQKVPATVTDPPFYAS